MTPVPMNDPIAEFLARAANPASAQGGDPVSTPPVSIPVFVNGAVVHVTSPEEALRLQQAEQQKLAQAAQIYAQEAQRLQAENEQFRSQPVAQAPPDLGAPKPQDSYNPEAFVTEFIKDPKETFKKFMKEDEEFKKLQEENKRVNFQLSVREFADQHPLYATPQILQGLDQIRSKMGLEPTAQGFELAALKAQQLNYLKSETQMRAEHQAQLQQQWQNQIAQQQEQVPQGQPQQAPQYNPSGLPLHASNPPMAAGYMNSYQPPPPPPNAGRSGYSPGTGSIGTANAMIEAGQLRGPQLKEYIQMMEQQGIK